MIHNLVLGWPTRGPVAQMFKFSDPGFVDDKRWISPFVDMAAFGNGRFAKVVKSNVAVELVVVAV